MSKFEVGDRVTNVVGGDGTYSFLPYPRWARGTVVLVDEFDGGEDGTMIQVAWDYVPAPLGDLGWNMIPAEIEKVDE